MTRWTINLAFASFLLFFLVRPDLYGANAEPEEVGPTVEFFNACSGGDTAFVLKSLKEHPEWVNAHTQNGETCLHLTGIYGADRVTQVLVDNGANPNIRSTYEKGLRMHPLSWNVYGGHLANIEILLEAGADINLDFDSMKADDKPVTALDVLLELLKNEPGDDRFVKMEKLFRENGAKTMEEVLKSKAEGEL